MDIEKIMTEGIVFKGCKSTHQKENKVKTKAKKKSFVTGAPVSYTHLTLPTICSV